MIDRRLWLAIAVLAVLAAATEVLVWLNRPPPRSDAYAGPPRSDYTLDDFTLNSLDDDGSLSLRVSGPRLARDGANGSIFVTRPRFALFDNAGNPWQGNAQTAWVNKDGSLMKLGGKVEMHRVPSAKVARIDIATSDLTAWPNDRRVATDAPATITEPGSILRGTGLRADLDTKVLELLSDVHSTLQPKSKGG